MSAPHDARAIGAGSVQDGALAVAAPQTRVLVEARVDAKGVLPGLSPSTPTGVTSEQRQRALRDPLVQRVKELFDGTIKDVRPMRRRDGALTTIDNEVDSAVENDASAADGE